MKKIMLTLLAVVLMSMLMSSCFSESLQTIVDNAIDSLVGNDGHYDDGNDYNYDNDFDHDDDDKDEDEYIPQAVEIDPEHIILAENDYRYAWVVAFLCKDSDRCEQILKETGNAVDPGQMGRLEDIFFGSYSVEVEDEYSIKFDFEIVSSSYDLYPVGSYSASVSVGGLVGLSCNYNTRPSLCDESLIDEYEEEYEFISEFIASCAYTEFPDDYRSNEIGWTYLTEALFVYYARAHGIQYTSDVELTLYELREVADKVYDIDDFELYTDGCWKRSNGKYSRPGHGGLAVEAQIADITEKNDVISLDIQYFGDWVSFSDAGVVRFTIEKTHSEYPYRLLKIQKIKTSQYSICMRWI